MYLIISITCLLIVLTQSFTSVFQYSQTPILEYLLFPNGADIQNLSMVFSHNQDKIAFLYKNMAKNVTFLRIYKVMPQFMFQLCNNSSQLLNGYQLQDFSYESGPLTWREEKQPQLKYVPQIWSITCKIQYQWSNISAAQFRISKRDSREFIAFHINQGEQIQEYDLNSKNPIKSYKPGLNQFFQSYFQYSQNHEYLITTLFNQTSLKATLAGLDGEKGQKIFSINQPIIPIKVIKNGSIILGYNSKSKDIYAFDKQGHSKLILSSQNWVTTDPHPQFCTDQNFFITKKYISTWEVSVLNIFSSDPPIDRPNSMKQQLSFPKDKYGEITHFVCRNNKLAVLNSEGILRIYEYKEIDLLQRLPILWVVIIGVSIIVIIVFLICIFRYKRNKRILSLRKLQQKSILQSLVEQKEIQKQQKKYQIEQKFMIKQQRRLKSRIFQQNHQDEQEKIQNQRLSFNNDQKMARLAKKSSILQPSFIQKQRIRRKILDKNPKNSKSKQIKPQFHQQIQKHIPQSNPKNKSQIQQQTHIATSLDNVNFKPNYNYKSPQQQSSTNL